MTKKLLEYMKKIDILYVEDDTSTREELVYFLESKVKKLYVAKDGQEGLETFEKEKPDLIVTDVQMPRMTGIDMIKKIREIDKKIPIMVITAFNDTDYLFEAIKLNVTSYLTKPLDLFLLVENLSEISKNLSLEKENEDIINTLNQYKSIVDERSIIAKIDLEKKITYANEPFVKLSPLNREDLVGQDYSIIYHPSTTQEMIEDIWNTISVKKELWQGTLKTIGKNDIVVTDTIIKPILDTDGNIVEFISLSNDITDLENSKEYFKLQNRNTSINLKETIQVANSYKEAIEKSNMILIVNLDHQITYVNEAFTQLTGFTYGDLEGKSFSDLNYYNLLFDSKSNEEIFSKYIYKGKFSSKRKDGSIYYCNLLVYPLRNIDGDISEYMIIEHDITLIYELHNELEDTQKEIIYRLGEIGETRSSETGYHVKRVAEYSKLLAKKIDMPKDDLKLLFMASPMHDIGKIGIPDSVLNKPGKLTAQEWEVMKTHSQIGYNILKTSNRDILKAAAIVAYTHHEKWDGSGYPNGTSGEDIHIYGRITAIADVFDALGSDRVYKKAWELDKIIEFLKDQKGKHFDPKLLEIFLNNLDEFLEIRDKYKDI